MTVQFLLYDLPSDHEVELNIVTECDVIRSIISNKDQGKKVKVIRATNCESFLRHRTAKTKEVKYIHLSGHGNEDGLGFINGIVEWGDVASKVTESIYRLKSGQRILCVSCCHSEEAVDQMIPHLRGYFTGVYYFSESEIHFSTTMTVWSMFYRQKNLKRLHRKIVPQINQFFATTSKEGEEPLKFRSVRKPPQVRRRGSAGGVATRPLGSTRAQAGGGTGAAGGGADSKRRRGSP